MKKYSFPYEEGSQGLAVVSSRKQLPAGLLIQKRPNLSQLLLLTSFLVRLESLEKNDLLEVIETELNISRREVKQLLKQVVTFLWLSTIKPANTFVTPAKAIDDAWKLFILQTQTYRTFQQCTGYVFDRIERTSATNANLAQSQPWMSNRLDVCRFLGRRCNERWWYTDLDI